jgi:hypothetical protein
VCRVLCFVAGVALGVAAGAVAYHARLTAGLDAAPAEEFTEDPPGVTGNAGFFAAPESP